MKKIFFLSFFVSSLLFAENNIIGFADLSKAVEKIFDNQVMLEKKITKLESENKSLKQLVDESISKMSKFEQNDNTLNTKILKLELKIEDINSHDSKNTKIDENKTAAVIIKNIQPIAIPMPMKKIIVVSKKAFIRKNPEKLCGNIIRTVEYGEKLVYTNKVNNGHWYKLLDETYISKLAVSEYEEGKEYKMVIPKKSNVMECK